MTESGTDIEDGPLRRLLASIAHDAARSLKLPDGYQSVVVVTDAAGAWVGVGTSPGQFTTESILRCALEGDDYAEHR